MADDLPVPKYGAPDAWAIENGYRLIAGVDEVGVGPMAGPVVAAAVLFDGDVPLLLVNDSKLLTPEAREAAYDEIRSRALDWTVGVVEPDLVDRINVWHAAHLAMRRALQGLRIFPDFVLIDGLPPRGIKHPHRAFVDGDALSPRIGAASIVAKVTRDRIMERMDLLYPGYGLAQHKGYCTPEHRRAVDRLGPSPIHRRRWDPVETARALRLPLDLTETDVAEEAEG